MEIRVSSSDCMFIKNGNAEIQILARDGKLLVIMPKSSRDINDVNPKHVVFEVTELIMKGIYS